MIRPLSMVKLTRQRDVDMDASYACPIAYQMGMAPTRTTRLQKGRLLLDQQGLHIHGPVDCHIAYDQIRKLDYEGKFLQFFIRVQARCTIYFTPVLFHAGLIEYGHGRRMVQVYTRLHRHVGGVGRCDRCGYNMLKSRDVCPECGCDRIYPGAPLRS